MVNKEKTFAAKIGELIDQQYQYNSISVKLHRVKLTDNWHGYINVNTKSDKAITQERTTDFWKAVNVILPGAYLVTITSRKHMFYMPLKAMCEIDTDVAALNLIMDAPEVLHSAHKCKV